MQQPETRSTGTDIHLSSDPDFLIEDPESEPTLLRSHPHLWSVCNKTQHYTASPGYKSYCFVQRPFIRAFLLSIVRILGEGVMEKRIN